MKYPAHLILTVDYEIFGNGTGDISCCVANPAQKIIEVTDKYEAPVTFFVEVLEFLVLRGLDTHKSGVEKVTNQLTHAIKSGHDAQLHLHPQWNIEVASGGAQPCLDFSRWRIGDLAEKEIDKLLIISKRWLEELLVPVKSSYSCNVFRAGGWCIQPSALTVESMKKHGFVIESTVAPGAYNPTKGEWSDFRSVPDLPYWYVQSDVCEASVSGIVETPITTGKISRTRHLKALKTSRKSGDTGMAPDCKGSYQGPISRIHNIRGKLAKLLRLGHVMLDFSTMPGDVLIDVTRQWIEHHKGADGPMPIVAIGHTKNFTPASEDALNIYLAWAKSQDIEFSTYGKWYEALGE
jgi:hypothetical protein